MQTVSVDKAQVNQFPMIYGKMKPDCPSREGVCLRDDIYCSIKPLCRRLERGRWSTRSIYGRGPFYTRTFLKSPSIRPTSGKAYL